MTFAKAPHQVGGFSPLDQWFRLVADAPDVVALPSISGAERWHM